MIERTASAGGSTPEHCAKPLTVLHIFDHSLPILSGYSIRSAALLKEQRKRGWRTIHLTTPRHTEPGPSPDQQGEFVFHRTGKMPRLPKPISFVGDPALILMVAREIVRLAKTEKPDLLHAHSPALNGLAAWIAARRLGIPLVYEIRAFWEDAAVNLGTATEGGIRYKVIRSAETFVLRRCDAAATICDGLRRDIVARGIAADKIGVVANGVMVDQFPFRGEASEQAKQHLGWGGRTIFGYLGSLYDYEGLDTLLAAWPAIQQKCPESALLIAGGGPRENALKEQAQGLGLEESVRFLGYIPHDRIQEYSAAVDVFAFPRHRMRLTETVTPLKPLEAMAQGGIVLASDVGGHREMVNDGQTGRLFPADDVSALARAALDLMADRSSWPRIRQAARAFVETQRTWRATTAAYQSIYARALKRPV